MSIKRITALTRSSSAMGTRHRHFAVAGGRRRGRRRRWV